MSKAIELRLTKTEFEKLMLLALAGSFMECMEKEPGTLTDKLMAVLMITAELHGLKNMVSRDEDDLVISETATEKLEKLINAYEKYAYEKISREKAEK